MNEIIKRAVFLDFDGVLFDTIREAYCISMIALGRASCISEVNLNAPHFLEFYKNRFLIGPAWNYYYLVPLLDAKLERPVLDIKTAFCDATRDPDPKKYNTFEKTFFNARSICIEKDFDNWLSLINPYAFVDDLRHILHSHPESFFLITTRDRSSVLHILRAHHLRILETKIYGKEEYGKANSKKDVIRRLIEDHRIEESIFIDDLESHLLDCQTIENLALIQAQWGYVASERKEDNSARIIQDIENLIQGKNVWT